MANSAQLRNRSLQGSWDAALAALYGADPAVLQRQRGRYAAALEQFELYLGRAAGAGVLGTRAARAGRQPHRPPARLRPCGGGHAGSCGGGGPQHGWLCAGQVQGFNKLDVIDLATAEPQAGESTHSASLIRGIAEGFRAVGKRSAALMPTRPAMCCGAPVCPALRPLRWAWPPSGTRNTARADPGKLAGICQYAENTYFGKPSGLLDQLTSAVGGVIFADFADPRTAGGKDPRRRPAAARHDPLRHRYPGQPQRTDRRVCGHPAGDGGCGGLLGRQGAGSGGRRTRSGRHCLSAQRLRRPRGAARHPLF